MSKNLMICRASKYKSKMYLILIIIFFLTKMSDFRTYFHLLIKKIE